MYLIPIICTAFILYFTIFGERGLLHIYHLNGEMEDTQQRLETVKDENMKLIREVDALKNDRRYLESIARKDFGMVRKNEVIYQFSQQPQQQQLPQQRQLPAKQPLKGK